MLGIVAVVTVCMLAMFAIGLWAGSNTTQMPYDTRKRFNHTSPRPLTSPPRPPRGGSWVKPAPSPKSNNRCSSCSADVGDSPYDALLCNDCRSAW